MFGLVIAHVKSQKFLRSSMMDEQKSTSKKIRLAFFRGANFKNGIGVTDWRIALYMPEFDFETIIFGQGGKIKELVEGVRFFSPKIMPVPGIRSLMLNLIYFFYACKIKPDIVVYNQGMSLAVFIFKLTHWKTKFVLDIRSIPVVTHGFWGLISQIHFYLAVKARMYDALSVITISMLADIKNTYHVGAIPTVVWGSGYDDNLFLTLPEKVGSTFLPGLDGRFILMFHGSINKKRGLDLALHGLSELHQRGMQDVVLVLIGQGPAEAELKELANMLKLSEHIFFYPPIPHEQIPPYVNCADLGIDPLPDHPWWLHQSPLKVYEYLAMGIPVLASRIPCHQDISPAVLFLKDYTSQAFADAVESYRLLPIQEKDGLRAIALRDSKLHTWRERARVLADFLKYEVLADG